MNPCEGMARYCAWWAMWCRAWDLDDPAHEFTRYADGWRALEAQVAELIAFRTGVAEAAKR